VKAIIKNEGTVILRIPSGSFRVQQVLPLTDDVRAKLDQGEDPVPPGESEVNWDALGPDRKRNLSMHLEPGETDEVLADFFVDSELRLIEVYTFFDNEKAKPNGWGLTTLHDFSAGATERSLQNVAGEE
jgi:hypothetical protein